MTDHDCWNDFVERFLFEFELEMTDHDCWKSTPQIALFRLILCRICVCQMIMILILLLCQM